VVDEAIPAQAIDAERACIGAMLISLHAARRIRIHLDPGDFYGGANRKIFDAMCTLMDDEPRDAPDIIVIIERLRAQGDLGEVGGPLYLTRCQESVTTTDHAEYYAKLVRRASLDRQINKQLHKTNADKSPENVRALGDLIFALQGVGGLRMLDFQTDIVQAVEQIIAEKSDLIHTGFFEVDALLGGLEPGDVLVVGGRTGVGKTAFMTRMALNTAMHGEQSVYMTTEMRDTSIVQRILPQATGIPAIRYRQKRLTSREKELVRGVAKNDMSRLPLKIFGRSRLSIREISSATISAQARIIYIDYLQRCTLPRAESRAYQIEEFMVQLKSFGVDTGTRIVLGVQLDRGMDREPNRPPQLSDLRGSGAIEHEADAVILLWEPPAEVLAKRPGYIPPTAGHVTAELRLAKNRNGLAKVAAYLALNKELVKFCEHTQIAREEASFV